MVSCQQPEEEKGNEEGCTRGAGRLPGLIKNDQALFIGGCLVQLAESRLWRD